MVKLHRNLVAAVCEILNAVWQEHAYADKTLEKILKSNPRWGARDRAFIAETTYEIIRNYRLLAFLAGNTSNPWEILAAYFLHHGLELPQWEEFSQVNAELIQRQIQLANGQIAIQLSYSDEWIEWFKQDFPTTFEMELKALNHPASLILRANRLKTSALELKKKLSAAGHECNLLGDAPDALIALKKWNVFQDPLFQAGCYEIQDANSQKVAPFMDLSPGMRVIDACAGGGGKTLHIAALMHNQGKVLAMDIENWKLENLRKRARRAGAHNVETRWIESSKTIKRQERSCDRLLLDVPCSGTGVVRRNPDTKWKVNETQVQQLIEVQKDILHRYSNMVKSGGKLIYSTCSVLSLENSKQIAYFCDEHPDFRLEKELFLSPGFSGFDGFYMARLIRA